MLVVEVPEDVITSSAPTLHSLKEKSHCTTGEHGNDNHSDMIQLEDSASLKRSKTNFYALKDSKSVRVDISFKSPSHTGLQTTGMVISRDQGFQFYIFVWVVVLVDIDLFSIATTFHLLVKRTYLHTYTYIQSF
jgi:hypothetical protein